MSHFEKIDNSGMNCGVKRSNFGFNFEPRTKSPHDVRKNTLLTPPYFCDIGIFDKVAVTLPKI